MELWSVRKNDCAWVASTLRYLTSVGQDHVRRYFADSARQNVHESAFIKIDEFLEIQKRWPIPYEIY